MKVLGGKGRGGLVQDDCAPSCSVTTDRAGEGKKRKKGGSIPSREEEEGGRLSGALKKGTF